MDPSWDIYIFFIYYLTAIFFDILGILRCILHFDPPVRPMEAKSQERKRELEQLRKQLASATVLDSRAPRFSIFGAWQAWL